jgi:hypothetical protein
MTSIIEYDALGEELLGEDLLGEDDDMAYDALGARRRRRRRGGADMRWQAELRAGAPGAPAISEKMLPLGFGQETFTAGSQAVHTFELGTNVAFRLERLVIDVRRVGASAQGIAVTVQDLKLGANSQFAGGRSVPAEIFAAGAQDTRLACDPVLPGVPVSLIIRLSALPTGSDSVIVTAGAIGRAVR